MRASGTILAGLFLGLAAALPAPAQPMDPGYQGPAPAEAGEDMVPASRPYVGLRGSYAFNANKVETWAPTTPMTNLRGSYASGYGGSLYIGTHLPLNLRLELEALYRWQPISTINLNGVGVAGAGGYSKVAAPMLNLLWDVPVDDDFAIRPFVGMGVGAAYTERDAYGAGGNVYLRGNRWDLAYSFLSGIAVPLDETSRLTAMYRWMQVRDQGHKCAASGAVVGPCLDNSVNSSSVDLGLEMDL